MPEECQAGTKVMSKSSCEMVPPVLPGSIFSTPEARHVHGELEHRDERRAGLLADGDGVAGVILMAVGQRHMGHAFARLAHGQARIFEGRVPGEKRIDQDARLAGVDADTGVTEPSDLHD